MYSMIMAGGRGSRFWPRSRKKQSKQTLNIVGKNTMIQDTVKRLLPLSGPEQILIVTNDLLADEIRRQLPAIPPENVIIEPESRSTAPCIGLAAVMIQKRAPGEVMACFAADHLIRDVDRFVSDVRFAGDIARETGQLVTFGVRPQRPMSGFGYLHAGEIVRERAEGAPSRRVERFIEKPDLATAEKFVEDPDYFINSGMFVWRADVFLEEMKEYLPEMHAGMERISASLDTPLEIKEIGEAFAEFEPVSVDYGIMEKSKRVVMVPAGFDWDDIGTWESLYHAWPKDAHGNAGVGRKLAVNTSNCLVYSPKKLVATIGLEDVIIVETDDALLVCRRDCSQDVSSLIDMLRQKRWEEYL